MMLRQVLHKAPFREDVASWAEYVRQVRAYTQGTLIEANAAKVILGMHLWDLSPASKRDLAGWKDGLAQRDLGIEPQELDTVLLAAKRLWAVPDDLIDKAPATLLDCHLDDLPSAFRALVRGDLARPADRVPNLGQWKRRARGLVEQLAGLPESERDQAMAALLEALEVWIPGIGTMWPVPEPEVEEPVKGKSRQAAVQAAAAESSRRNK